MREASLRALSMAGPMSRRMMSRSTISVMTIRSTPSACVICSDSMFSSPLGRYQEGQELRAVVVVLSTAILNHASWASVLEKLYRSAPAGLGGWPCQQVIGSRLPASPIGRGASFFICDIFLAAEHEADIACAPKLVQGMVGRHLDVKNLHGRPGLEGQPA